MNGDFSILIHPAMADLSRPVIIKTPEGEHTVDVRADAEVIRASVAATADPDLACVMKISWKALTGK